MKTIVQTALSRDVLPLLVAAGALAMFAIGYMGPLSAAFDFSAQFTAHWLIIAVVAVIASFATRFTYSILAASILAAVLAPSALTAWYSLPPPAVTEFAMRVAPATVPETGTSTEVAPNRQVAPNTRNVERRSFTLLTYNLYNLNLDLAAIKAEIARHDADVVILVEFGPNKKPLKPWLQQRYPYHKACDHNWDCGVAFFSRLPVAKFTMVDAPDDAGPPYISAEVSLGTIPVRIIGTHILSPNHGPRANFIELDHLAATASRSRMPTVVAGDLNTTIWANAFDNFRRRSGLVHMGHLIPTWPVAPLPLPQLGIDHIFTSPSLRVSRLGAGHAAGSDHLPLVATIELR